MKDSPDANKYDKIKHLVEVDDDILAVFTMTSSDMKELYIAKTANIDKNYIDSIVHILGINQVIPVERPQISDTRLKEEKANDILGKIKWGVTEYDKIRILKIYEEGKTIFVLINSNTQLEHTVDNILGYYYDLDDIPKSLF